MRTWSALTAEIERLFSAQLGSARAFFPSFLFKASYDGSRRVISTLAPHTPPPHKIEIVVQDGHKVPRVCQTANVPQPDLQQEWIQLAYLPYLPEYVHVLLLLAFNI